jgi:hypothetical protein
MLKEELLGRRAEYAAGAVRPRLAEGILTR